MAKRPDYRLTVNGADGLALQGRLISLTLRDNRGFEADQLDLVVDDHDGQLALPPEGAIIGVHLGWKGEALVDKGQYQVDEIEHSGPPDTLTLRARSADFRAGLLEKRTQSWPQVTLADILATIAGRNELTPVIAEDLAGQAIAHIDQTDESDAHFLTRLARDRDAIATVKGSATGKPRLLFVHAGDSRTASGKEIPAITVKRRDGDKHTFNRAARDNKYTGVRAQWYDKATFTASEIIVGEKGNLKALRKTYPSEADAGAAAWAEWRRLSRAGRRMSVTLAQPDPSLCAETRIALEAWKEGIDGAGWVASTVTHQVNDGGYTASLEIEPVTSVTEE